MSAFSSLTAATSEFDHFRDLRKMKNSRIFGLFGFLPMGSLSKIALI
jgi:hypothetical protein